MTGQENAVTYPQFLTLPNGDLFYFFRQGVSGAGDTYLNRWSIVTHSWTNVNYNAGQQPIIAYKRAPTFLRGRRWQLSRALPVRCNTHTPTASGAFSAIGDCNRRKVDSKTGLDSKSTTWC
jgi:hypothetical protein